VRLMTSTIGPTAALADSAGTGVAMGVSPRSDVGTFFLRKAPDLPFEWPG